MVRKLFLFCGIASSLLYVALNILGALRWEGYSLKSQAFSELFAVGAPSRPLVVPLGLAYDVLVIAFGLGVWVSAGPKRALRVVGGLLVAYGVIGLPAPFTSMQLRGAEQSPIHLILTGLTVLFILLIIGFGATAFGKQFRFYSIATILVILVFGALAGQDAPRIAANLPTPWHGVMERINIGAFLLWVVVLSIALLRAQVERPQAGLDGKRDSG